MIHTAKQLKDKVKNLSGGKSDVAQTLIRTYMMERFLEIPRDGCDCIGLNPKYKGFRIQKGIRDLFFGLI